MSTRACYVFQEGPNTLSHIVYKHHDGYPTGAVEWLAAARALAWPLPRYEADEFAASFIAANKDGPGGLRLCGAGEWRDLCPPDIEYLYIVRPENNTVYVEGYAVDCSWATRKWETPVQLFAEPLATIEHANIKNED